jgi:hypothetical protein
MRYQITVDIPRAGNKETPIRVVKTTRVAVPPVNA